MRLALCALMLLTAVVPSAARELTVAADGSGNFRTIQSAIDSIPGGNTERVVIFIKNGTYPEQVRIHNSFITLRGEDRKKTLIVADVDSSACQVPAGASVEEHCNVVGADGTNLVFENLTIENTHRGQRGKGAALSAAGDATRIIVANVDVIGYGGDTFVLSARRNRMGGGGEYYVNNVYVSGTYHIIVPRGTTYVTASKFWCIGGEKICLFAEGVTRETDKLVIRNSIIDGPEPFGLGSYFRDVAWYFVDDTFSGNLLADGAIFRNPAKNYEMKWGEGRIYFAGNVGPNYPWLKDNIEQSPARTREAVTAAWVFPEWDPESTRGPAVRGIERADGQIRVIFSENVTVHGAPRLQLASGKTAEYVSGSGSNTLSFRGDGQVKAIQLRSGAIFASAASVHQRDAEVRLR